MFNFLRKRDQDIIWENVTFIPTTNSKNLVPDFVKGWHICQLEVMECREVPWPDSIIQEKYKIEDCGWRTKDFAYESKINLLTGRTHQVILYSPLQALLINVIKKQKLFFNRLLTNGFF